MIATRPDGVIEVFNRGAEQLLGYTRQEMIGLKTPVMLHVRSEMIERAKELSLQLGRSVEPDFGSLVACARNGELDQREWTYVRKDGSMLTVLLSITALRDDAGDVSGYLAVAQDQSKYQRVERAHHEAERRLRMFVENVSDYAIYQVDPEGRVLNWNTGAERIIGYSTEEILGRHIEMLFKPEDVVAGRPAHLLAEAVREGHVMDVGQRRRKDGSLFWSNSTITPLLDEKEALLGFIIFSQDITAQQQVEEALRASADDMAQQKHAVDQHAIVAITDVQSRIIHANDRFCEISGYSREELLGKHHRILNSGTHPREFFAVMYRTIARGKIWRGEICNRAKTGELYWTQSTIVPLLGPNGKPVQYYAIRTDITGLKKLEQSLAAARDQAMEVSRHKSEFLATMSHEIRTPMNAIIGMGTLLADTKLDETQADMLRTMTGGAEALLAIINDILDFSRIEAGKLRLDMEDFDLHAVVVETTSLLAERARQKGLEITCDTRSAPPYLVLGDGGRVRQILMNLIGNAVKFTDRGEVAVQVKIVAEDDERVTVRLEVRDTGIGVPKAQQARLFEPFVQGDASMTRRFGGTGLGLAITRQLVQAMNGETGFSSVEGAGSTFWVEVPFTRRGALPEHAATTIPPGLRALVVDDNATNREILLCQVERFGFVADTAYDGPSALEKLRDAVLPYDVVLLDWKMPGLSGTELAVAVHALRDYGKVPLIMLSSGGPTLDPVSASMMGFAELLMKPVTDDRLQQCLQKLLANRRAPSAQEGSTADKGATRSLRLLLAEDNAANQKVATMLLTKMGHTVDCVVNGRRALEQLAACSYDAVLMDCQMPVMDGYEATRRIRATEALSCAPRMPVIALTAHARREDRQRCLDAGMDAYLSKPIRRAELEDTLAAIGAENCEPKSGPARSPTPSELVLDPEAMALVAGLPGEKGASLLPEIIELYLADEPGRLASLTRHYEARNSAALASEVHSFGGNAATFGGIEVRRISLAVEDAALAGDWPSAGNRLEELRRACVRLREAATLTLPAP